MIIDSETALPGADYEKMPPETIMQETRAYINAKAVVNATINPQTAAYVSEVFKNAYRPREQERGKLLIEPGDVVLLVVPRPEDRNREPGLMRYTWSKAIRSPGDKRMPRELKEIR